MAIPRRKTDVANPSIDYDSDLDAGNKDGHAKKPELFKDEDDGGVLNATYNIGSSEMQCDAGPSETKNTGTSLEDCVDGKATVEGKWKSMYESKAPAKSMLVPRAVRFPRNRVNPILTVFEQECQQRMSFGPQQGNVYHQAWPWGQDANMESLIEVDPMSDEALNEYSYDSMGLSDEDET